MADEERRKQWVKHRDRLMGLFANNGRRPQAWWKYESPVPWPGFQPGEIDVVVLGAAEVRELERSWREAFDESLEPGFTFRGHNGWEAHLQFLIFHDCPADLAERWAAAPEAA